MDNEHSHDHVDAQDDLVIDDDDLTCDDVAGASGVEEPRFDSKASKGIGIASSFRPMSSLSLKYEDEAMDNLEYEEDEEDYKCDVENNDDGDYVDVEDECGSLVVEKVVILMYFVWMFYEFGQKICIYMFY